MAIKNLSACFENVFGQSFYCYCCVAIASAAATVLAGIGGGGGVVVGFHRFPSVHFINLNLI